MDKIKLVQELRDDEGEKLRAYKDHLGYWTIGVGHLIDPARGANPAPFGVDLRNGGFITAEQSEQLLLADIAEKEKQLDARLAWWRTLSDNRQRVLLNMAFQLGINGLLAFKNTLACVHKGDYRGATAGMLASKWAAQTPNRAKRLADRMVAG